MAANKVLPQGMFFPYDFGFLPSTRGEDGDPLDVLLLMDEPAFPGCVVPARLIGVLQAEQNEKGKTTRNDRFVAALDTPYNSAEYRWARARRDSTVPSGQPNSWAASRLFRPSK